MKVTGLDHLVLTVADLEATVDFYTRVLGMTVSAYAEGRLALKFGSQKINLHEAGNEPAPHARRAMPGSADICFLTGRPLEDWLQQFAEEDVAVVEGPVRQTGALGPMTSIYVRDPDGNLLEIAAYGLPA
ncbi:MAG: VOC family protein [Candidatus Dormibacteraeota bacterium]|nr:VOC family protein [Candidatus Dormibacteraeota bacterium]